MFLLSSMLLVFSPVTLSVFSWWLLLQHQLSMMLDYIVTLSMFNHCLFNHSPTTSLKCSFTIWSSPVTCSTWGDCLDAGLCVSKQKEMDGALECLERWPCNMNTDRRSAGPCTCTKDYDPVCGINGRNCWTYSIHITKCLREGFNKWSTVN